MLKELLKLEENDVVSIVGSGGKTSFMTNLAKELKEELKIGETILVTTTTKIKIPTGLKWDEIFIPNIIFLKTAMKRKLVYYGEGIKDGKILGIKNLEGLEGFKYTLIEADGSKQLPLKANRAFEPVVLDDTTITVGVIPWGYIGRFVSNKIIFNLEEFKERFSKTEITRNTMRKIITDSEGLFKGARGRKILVISHVDEIDEEFVSFYNYLKKNLDMEIIFGNQKEGKYYDKCDFDGIR